MKISVQISYYCLRDNYSHPVNEFLDMLGNYPQLEITSGMMSTLIVGKYENIMVMLNECLKPFLEKYPSVFTLTIASACNSCQV